MIYTAGLFLQVILWVEKDGVIFPDTETHRLYSLRVWSYLIYYFIDPFLYLFVFSYCFVVVQRLYYNIVVIEETNLEFQKSLSRLFFLCLSFLLKISVEAEGYRFH